MLSSFRNRFGIPGVISVIALVFAMLGGAYAASNDSGSGKASASAKRGKPGRPGKPGKPGPAGPQGPAGPAGPAGSAGAKGDKGDTGNAGAAGKGVTGVPLAPGEGPVGEECEEGGVEYTSASGVNVVCKGEVGPVGPTGATGATGPPGPTCPGGQCVLPEGASLTGIWSFRVSGVTSAMVSISYPLRVPDFVFYHYVKFVDQHAAGAPPECQGDALEPTAQAGHLCVYEGESGSEAELVNATPPEFPSGGTDFSSGKYLSFLLTVPANEAKGAGSWALTRPTS